MSEPQPAPASTTSERVERKYPLPEVLLEAAVAELHGLLPIYRYTGTHDWSSIRTTYLDSHELYCYQEYQQNLPVRRKIRIRQYGIEGQFDNVCWVELKVKNRNISLKRRFRCFAADLPALMRGQDILDRIIEQNDGAITQTYHTIRSLILEYRLTPAVRVDYERLSFQPHHSNGLRLTLDRNVRFHSACLKYRGPLGGLIIEIKHHGTKPSWFPELREKLGLKRARRFSKFARSIRQLNELREGEDPT